MPSAHTITYRSYYITNPHSNLCVSYKIHSIEMNSIQFNSSIVYHMLQPLIFLWFRTISDIGVDYRKDHTELWFASSLFASEEELLGDALHELFHTLGRIHEHNRPDRDRYIRVLWGNIFPGKKIHVFKTGTLKTTVFREMLVL